MDFGFAPGNGALAAIRQMLARRRTTTVIATPSVTTVQGFINRLKSTTAIPKPVDDLLLGAHANAEGFLAITMFPGQSGDTDYETLEETLAEQRKSVKIEDALIGYKQSDPVTHAVHLKGCNIGRATGFLLKLKEALGGHVKVTGANHFYWLYVASTEGVFETLLYEIIVQRPHPFVDRAAALTEFEALNFKLYDGTPVSGSDWNKVIPRDPNASQTLSVNRPLGRRFGNRASMGVEIRYDVSSAPWSQTISFADAASVPQSADARMRALREALQSDPRVQDQHPYPAWARMGFTSFADFMRNHSWVFTQHGKNLSASGTRHIYDVMIPITDPATVPAGGWFGEGVPVFNFYPNTGSQLQPITDRLRVDDTRFFSTV